MRVFVIVLISTVLLTTSPVSAQTEGQFRFLLHSHHMPEGRSVGFAGWAIAPNLLAEGPASGLFIAGPLFKGEEKGKERWTEILAGQLVSVDGKRQNFFSLRNYIALAGGRVSAYAEENYCDGKWLIQPKISASLPATPLQFGAELDAVVTGKELLSVTTGPRLVLPFKMAERDAHVALAYHHPVHGDDTEAFVRAYLTVNLF